MCWRRLQKHTRLRKGIALHSIPYFGDDRSQGKKKTKKVGGLCKGKESEVGAFERSVVFPSSIKISPWIKRMKRNYIPGSRTREILQGKYYFSSDPVWRYLCLPLVRYLSAANRRLHFFKQTTLKPGCAVIHFNNICSSAARSCTTSSLLRFYATFQFLTAITLAGVLYIVDRTVPTRAPFKTLNIQEHSRRTQKLVVNAKFVLKSNLGQMNGMIWLLQCGGNRENSLPFTNRYWAVESEYPGTK